MATLRALTEPFPSPALVTARHLRELCARSVPTVIVVLDDDPTGTQSVAEVPVLLTWGVEDFEWALAQGSGAVYVMTNTRSLPPSEAREVVTEIVVAAERAAAEADVALVFVSRSDSTLRSHFPLECAVVRDQLERAGGQVDLLALVPAFPEAGRVTVGGVHYVRVDGDYLPSSRSEFASDATFGYRSSHLAQWVEERTGGRVPAEDVDVVGLGVVRGPRQNLVDRLLSLPRGAVAAFDATAEEDLLAVAAALVVVEQRGRTVLYQVGPPFMRARLGQERREPVCAQDIERAAQGGVSVAPQACGGLVVVGSHVALTTAQLAALDARGGPGATAVEIEVEQVLDPALRAACLDDVCARTVDGLRNGRVVLRTSRLLCRTEDAQESLTISRAVSDAVVEAVRRVLAEITPRYVVAKGGITSSDVALRGLGMTRAWCVGSMLPGIVSLWVAHDGLAAGLPYVVFPGNVGDKDSLATVVETLDGVEC